MSDFLFFKLAMTFSVWTGEEGFQKVKAAWQLDVNVKADLLKVTELFIFGFSNISPYNC